ncbi:MAG: hypothetical protein LBR70_00910 [Lactobacillaceae bacterium]|nr:hypothetical protein [Lactobacillaceae bacterium]
MTDIWNASLIFIVYAQFMFGAGIRLFRKGPELVVSDYGIGYYKYFIFKDVIYWTDVYGFSHAKTNAIVVEHRIHIDKKGSFLSKLKRIFPERNIGFSTVFLENYDDEKLKELLYARYKNHLLRLKEEKNAKRK